MDKLEVLKDVFGFSFFREGCYYQSVFNDQPNGNEMLVLLELMNDLESK